VITIQKELTMKKLNVIATVVVTLIGATLLLENAPKVAAAAPQAGIIRTRSA
jgi:hypothetical protein